MLAGASRRHRPVFSGGAVQLFSFSFSFLLSGDDFFSGEGNIFCGVFSFWSGGGAFFGVGVLIFFFTWGGGSPLIGEKRAFMAEPSDRPAINDRLVGKKVGVNMIIKKKQKKGEKIKKT